MKKPVFFSVLALGSTIATFGQSHHTRGFDRLSHARQGHTVAKLTTANAARCIAIASKAFAGPLSIVTDSASYSYSGTRGGSVMGTMKFDNGTSYTNSGGGLENDMKYTQTFDSHNNILTYTEQQYDASSGTFINSSNNNYTYDASNHLLSEILQIWDATTSAWVNSNKYIYTYDAANNMTTNTIQSWDGTTWSNAVFDTFTYNSANNKTAALTSTWNTGTSAWDSVYKATFTYDASNNMTSELDQIWNGSSWENSYQTLYSNFAAPGQFQQIISQSWNAGAFVNESKDSVTWNSYNQPVYNFQQSWSTATGAWNTDTFASTHFYYELYTTGITELNSNPTSMDVYPNPASAVLYINAVISEGTATTISLLDVTGRIVSTMAAGQIRKGSNSIQYPVDQLSPGIYFVRLTNDKANITRKIVIAK